MTIVSQVEGRRLRRTKQQSKQVNSHKISNFSNIQLQHESKTIRDLKKLLKDYREENKALLS